MLLCVLTSKMRLQREPITIGTAAALGGAALLGTGGTMAATGKMNAKNRRFQEEQAWKANQRNIENWERQNRYNEMSIQGDRRYAEERWAIENNYNSPGQQMARFKEAGLNPNLIYGQSNMGGSVSVPESDGAAPMPAANKSDHRDAPTPPIDLLSGIMAINQFSKDRTQMDYVREQIKTESTRRALMVAQTLGAEIAGKKSGRELDLFNELFQTSVDAGKAGLAKVEADTRLLGQQYEQNAEMFPTNLAKNKQALELGKKTLEGMGYENTVKKFNALLAESGANPNDALWERLMMVLMEQMGVGDIIKGMLPKLELPKLK